MMCVSVQERDAGMHELQNSRLDWLQGEGNVTVGGGGGGEGDEDFIFCHFVVQSRLLECYW